MDGQTTYGFKVLNILTFDFLKLYKEIVVIRNICAQQSTPANDLYTHPCPPGSSAEINSHTHPRQAGSAVLGPLRPGFLRFAAATP
jgi:abortive infection bacteriophage resistance protein